MASRTSTSVSTISTLSSRGRLSKRDGSVLESLEPRGRQSNDISGLTIGKLKFSSLGIHGRDNEVSIITNAFEEVFDQERKDKGMKQRHLILISGKSGTGKSKLVDTLEAPTKRRKGLLVRGKFDLNLRNEPYFAIARAYSEICGEILERSREDPESSSRIQNDIKETLGSELTMLAKLIPALNEILDIQEDSNKSSLHMQETAPVAKVIHAETTTTSAKPSSLPTAAESKNRFNYAFLRFTRVISRHFKSFVIVLDDLQWADASSLELLHMLLSDQENAQLLVIGTYRSNDADATHIFEQTLDEIQNKSKEDENDFKLTQIHLENLDLASVHTIIQDLLCMTDEQTLKLAEVCHKKTDGNVFYLLSFLALLKEQRLLQFNFGTISWTWDSKKLDLSTNATTNVIELLISRMNLLSPIVIELLKLAACLGSKFDVRTLELVWLKSTDRIPAESANKHVLMVGLDTLEREGFIESYSKGVNRSGSTYKWAHDKVQEAGLSLIPVEDRGSFNRRVGEILLSKLNDNVDELESNILLLVNLLNDGADGALSVEDSLRLVRLNLQASRKAVSMSAFESAAIYAEEGIRLLPSDSWKTHYDLTLELYSLGARVEGAIGNDDVMKKYCQVVLSQENMPTTDKFDVYNTLVDSIQNRLFFGEAIDILLNILSEFKCTFPKNKVMVGLSLVRQIIKVQGIVKTQDFSELEEMHDTTRIELMRLLDKLTTCFYLASDPRFPLVIFRSLHWSIKYGWCDFSPAVIATTGMVLSGVLHDLRAGSHLGEQALALLEDNGITSTKCRTRFLVYSHVFVWTKPFGTLLKPLCEVYEIGLRSGDTENAMYAIFHNVELRFFSGTSLEPVEEDLVMYSKQAKELKRDQMHHLCKIIRQAVLNLMGRDNIDDPLRMFGEAVSEEEYQSCINDSFLKSFVWLISSCLLTYYGKHVKLVDSYGIDFVSKAFVSSPNNMWYSVLSGVSCFAAARETGKRKYMRLGQKVLSRVKKWVDSGNPNVGHIEYLLEAELMALKGDKHATRKKYETAILVAVRSGYQHDAALASERYARYCLLEKDLDEAGYRLGESIRYWKSWGAEAKALALEIEFASLTKKEEQRPVWQ